MFRKLLSRTVTCFFLCALLTNISASSDDANSSTGRRRCVWAEKMLLAKLGLAEDVNDAEVVDLLDDPDKRTSAVILLIRYRKISSATPKLLLIVNDDNVSIFAKRAAAEALCDFGNREWMPTIKALSSDPNSRLHIPLKIDLAGLLARTGDYSQFEVVATRIDDNKRSVRYVTIQALGNFRHKTEPVTDLAAVLLTFTAISDPVPWLRERAIYSLEKIAKIKPEITSRVINALEANIDSQDKNLRRVCRVKLKMYGQELRRD